MEKKIKIVELNLTPSLPKTTIFVLRSQRLPAKDDNFRFSPLNQNAAFRPHIYPLASFGRPQMMPTSLFHKNMHIRATPIMLLQC